MFVLPKEAVSLRSVSDPSLSFQCHGDAGEVHGSSSSRSGFRRAWHLVDIKNHELNPH